MSSSSSDNRYYNVNLRIRRPVSPRFICLICVLAATLLALPSLFSGFFYDDYMQIAQLEGWSVPHGGTFDLYNFASGGKETAQLIEHGPLPWWTSPNFQMHFWRPLASAAIALQYFVFGHHAAFYHLVSLLLQGALIVAAGALFRRAVPSIWAFGLLLFAIDDAHWDAVGWIAAINGVLALLTSILSLLAYRRYREEEWKPGLVLALGAVALSLLSGEAGVGALGYLGAYELIGAPRRRITKLLPFAVVLVPYLIAYKLGGYGAREHLGYLDPTSGPVTFLKGAALRIPGLFGNLALGVPLELWWKSAQVRVLFALIGLAALIFTTLWLRAAASKLPEHERRGIYWLWLGALLSLIPSSAGPPGQRTLFVATLGAAPVFALLLRDGWSRLRDRNEGALRRGLATAGFALIVLPNVVLAPLLFLGKTLLLGKLAEYSSHMVSDTERIVSEMKPAASAPERVAIVSTDDPLTLIYVPFLRNTAQWRAFWSFSTASVPTTLRRVDARTIELSTTERFFASELETTLYGGKRPHLGSTVRLDGATVAIVEEQDGYPTRTEIRFDTRQDLEETRLIMWRDRAVFPVALPEVGQSVAFGARSWGLF